MSSPQRKPITGGGHLTELASRMAKAQGLSPAQIEQAVRRGLDPIPAAQIERMMDPHRPPATRVHGWLLMHTIGAGHRSPYAVDKKGNFLTLKHAATHLDIKPGNIYKPWAENERDGLCSVRDGKLLLHIHIARRRPEADAEIICTDNDSAYITKELAKMDPSKRAALEGSLKDINRRFDLTFSTFKLGLEHQRDHERRVTWAQYAVKLRENKDHGSPEKVREREMRRQLALPLVEKFVQRMAEKGLYELKTESVQSSEKPVQTSDRDDTDGLNPSPLAKRTLEGEKKLASSKKPPAELKPLLEEVAISLKRRFDDELTDATLKNFWKAAVANDPDVTVSDLAEYVGNVIRANKGYKQWAGIYSEFSASLEGGKS
jgi:hypothetical protein